MSLTMTTSEMDVPIESEACKALLDRVVSSTPLRRSARLRDLLAYVGRRTLEDGCTLIREQEIGVEVFGRPEGYDTTADNIVRVNATELRKRIDTYFETEGAHEPLVMEIPRGGYVTVFHYRAASPVEPEAEVHGEEPVIQESAAEVAEHPAKAPAAPPPAWHFGALVVSMVAVVALAAVCISLWMSNRKLQGELYPWNNKPTVAAFWSPFMAGKADTDMVVADSSLGLYEDLQGQQISLQDYLSRTYLTDPGAAKLPAGQVGTLRLLARRTTVSRGAFMMTQRLAAIEPLGNRIHTYFARNFNPGLIDRDNVILFGGRLSNPWMELFENRMNFIVKHDFSAEMNAGVPHSSVVNRAPAAGEQAAYVPTSSTGYCTIAYLPNPERNRNVLIITGTSSEAAEGCGQFLLAEAPLAALKQKLHVTDKFPYFEALLKTSHVAETPLTASVVAYRTYTSQH